MKMDKFRMSEAVIKTVLRFVCKQQKVFTKFLDKRKRKPYNTHVTEVTPCGPLAQSVEHLTFNQGVPRSSRGWITIFFAFF